MEYTQEHIDEIIAKFLADELQQTERVMLQTWLAGNAANQTYFDEMTRLHGAAAAERYSLNFDTDAAWSNVQRKISKDKNAIRTLEPRTLNFYMRIAAGVALLVTGSYFVYYLLSTPVEQFALNSTENVITDTLPNGTIAVLNKNTSLHYYFNKSKNAHRVELDGEAFFEVKSSNNERFIVESYGLMIEDFGTEFNVKAFGRSDTAEVAVLSGKVKFYTTSNVGLMLGPGESAFYIRSQDHFERRTLVEENSTSYVDRKFRFRNTPLRKALKQLNEVYEVTIALATDSIADCRITVNFQDESAETIVTVIAETLGLTVTKRGNGFELSGSGCE